MQNDKWNCPDLVLLNVFVIVTGMFGPCKNGLDDDIVYWPGRPKSMAISVKYEGEEMLPFYYITVGVPSIGR